MQIRFTIWQFVKLITAWLWNYNFTSVFYLAAVLRLGKLLFITSTFSIWQFVELITAWLWNYILFCSHSAVGQFTFIESEFCSMTVYKIHLLWHFKNSKIYVTWKWLKRRLTARCTGTQHCVWQYGGGRKPNHLLVQYWAFVSAWQTSLNIGKSYLSLVQSQTTVPGGRISNSTTSPSATVGCNFGKTFSIISSWQKK